MWTNIGRPRGRGCTIRSDSGRRCSTTSPSRWSGSLRNAPCSRPAAGRWAAPGSSWTSSRGSTAVCSGSPRTSQSGPGLLMPKPVRDAMIYLRNTETLNRLRYLAEGGAAADDALICGRLDPRRRGPRRGVARAALAPHAPCTPPPGCADAEPRKSPRIGVSARPSPGIGRKISCWCRLAVPPPSAPLIRFASRALQCQRAEHPPGDDPASRSPGAYALEPRLHPVGQPLDLVVRPSDRSAVAALVARARCCGMWV